MSTALPAAPTLRVAAAPLAGRAGGAPRGRTLFRLARRNPIATVGLVIVGALVLVALLADVLSPFDPNAQLGARLTPPGGPYALGLDQLGRDVLSRLIFGTRVSLQVSLTSVGLALLLGGGLGLLSGHYRGIFDTAAMRAMDVLFTLPSMILAIALAGLLGPTQLNVVIAIAIVTVPTLARITRAPTLVVGQADFVLAARAAGARDRRLLLLHVLPNVLGPVIVQTTVSMADAIIIEAALGFLGLGVPPPLVTWGNMLGTGRDYMELANNLTIFPGLAIMATVLGFNFAGDGLRDFLDPRLRTNG